MRIPIKKQDKIIYSKYLIINYFLESDISPNPEK